MTWPSPATASNTSPILRQPLGVGEAQRVVDDHRDAVLLGDQSRAGQPRDDAQLLLGAAGQRLVRHGAARQRAAADAQFAVDLHFEARRRTRCGPTAPPRCGTGRRTAAGWRRGAAPSPSAAVCAARARRCTRTILGLGVLTFGLGGIQLPLASLGAVHLQLRGHLAQRLGDLVVPARAICGRAALPRRARRRRRPARYRASSSPSSATSAGGPAAHASPSASALTAQLVVADDCPLRCQPLARDGQLGPARLAASPQHAGRACHARPAAWPPPRRPCDASRSRRPPAGARPRRRRVRRARGRPAALAVAGSQRPSSAGSPSRSAASRARSSSTSPSPVSASRWRAAGHAC